MKGKMLSPKSVKMSLRDLAVATMASILFGVASTEHTGENYFSTKGNCGRRHVKTTVSERIVNGTDAEQGDWPWMVGLYSENDTLHCGGVLISDQFVLTAAHCFPNDNISFISVRMGSTNKSNSADCSGETTPLHVAERINEPEGNAEPNGPVLCAEVEDVCVPLQQNCSFFMEDIAIVKLKRPVNFTDYIQPICLPENCDEPSLSAATYLAGWGLDYEIEILDSYIFEDSNGDEADEEVSVISFAPSTLNQINITLIDKTACQDQLNRTVPDYILCSTGGACTGDSGGPLVYENNGTWFFIGIHSGGDEHCYNPNTPGMHIKVSYYVSKFIIAFMELGNNSQVTRSDICATDEERVQCVTKLYASHNESVKYDSRNE
uniref:Putative trypsin-like serine protease n=1 Tax=Ixodes ricinus TaxID=34613 RepID=A0A147BWV9_IXORI